ncbi:MAG: ABC transporter substrate-binding protein, partial [Polaromonas sp.]|nr:ABC transporter substrate-binding protein [Polaromonas sp.]
MESFIAAKILVEAIRRSGADPTRAKIMSQLEKMNSYDAGGFKVSFSPENRVGSKFVEVTVIGRDGKLLR